MTKRALRLAATIAVLALLASCVSAPPYQGPVSMAGTWSYTTTDTNGNTYDHGTIRFSGDEHAGSWTMVNAYDIEYTGSWTLDGVSVVLVGEDSWEGKAAGPGRLAGTWRHDNGDAGTWEARRQ